MNHSSQKNQTENHEDKNIEHLAASAMDYLGPWLKSSREFSLRRFYRWKLLEDLYHNRRDLGSWNAREPVSNPGESFAGDNEPVGKSAGMAVRHHPVPVLHRGYMG